ncbi:LicD family protein [Vagococcus sp. DIV0080]|uniref:LicD family protein n=1 Tax=Candidatus Vagococcus giribetii TaxID=2230876 RepID=A0ABS3HU72_9ENTE|nr:LicD family protein [Vagococcus sp. DIV0080]MBO0477313.1 LicD family protein [Vagococcus sp. DIV0080]
MNNIDEMLELLKSEELKILKEFHKICEENKLKYTIAFGTMIGSVRHQGFIPWDDDIDVVMPIEDYKRFKELSTDKLSDKYFLQDSETDPGFIYPYMKIRLNNSCMVNPLSKKYKYKNKGIYMDIFPVNYLPKNKIVQKFQKYSLTIIGHIITTFCFETVKMGRTFPQKCAKLLLWIFNKVIPYKVLLFMHNKIVSIGKKETAKKYCIYCSEEMGFMDKYTLDLDYFEDRILLPFEDSKFYMPKNYDEIMTHIYGDYMAIPKEKKTHGIIFASNNMNYEEFLMRKGNENG